MKLRQALLITALAVIAAAKPHESKKSHAVKHSREHELTNRMGHGDHHRRDHGSASSLGSSHKDGSATQKPTHDKVTEHSTHSHKASVGAAGHELKKDLHLHHITEHNIDKKKDDDKDTGVLMESEHLIHVTARPAKAHRTKGNHHKNKSNNQTTQTPSNKGASPSTGKIQKTPKKYSAKKHGWKKTPRKEKTAKERLREKYERREKRAKALHHAITGKKN